MHLSHFISLTALLGVEAARHGTAYYGRAYANQHQHQHQHQASKRQTTYGFPPASTDWRNEERYVVMDNDWGSTGFIPFLIALDANMTVLGLSGNTLNTWALQSTLHGLALLEHGNLSCIPVARGADYPLIMTEQRFRTWTGQYGTLAWNGVFRPENVTAEEEGSDPTSGDPERISRAAFTEGYPNTTYIDQASANFMIEQVFKYPGKVSIYSAGALTNIALAIRLNASFARTAKELVVMGGYIDLNLFQTTSNLNQDLGSDINFILDAEAAHIALTADFPSITIAGNIANEQYLTPEVIAQINTSDSTSPYTDLLDDFVPFLPLWDETAAMIMAYPDTVTNSTAVYMDVSNAYDSPSLGKSYVWGEDFHPPSTRKVNYVTALNRTLYYERLTHAMMYPKTCVNGVPV